MPDAGIHARTKVCPFINITSSASASGELDATVLKCRRERCTLWVGDVHEGNCAFLVIATHLGTPAT